MSAVETANPIAGPGISVARPEAFRLSILVPMYNEEASADPFFDALLPVLDACGAETEVLCIDDGSADATVGRVLARQTADPRIKLISLGVLGEYVGRILIEVKRRVWPGDGGTEDSPDP